MGFRTYYWAFDDGCKYKIIFALFLSRTLCYYENLWEISFQTIRLSSLQFSRDYAVSCNYSWSSACLNLIMSYGSPFGTNSLSIAFTLVNLPCFQMVSLFHQNVSTHVTWPGFGTTCRGAPCCGAWARDPLCRRWDVFVTLRTYPGFQEEVLAALRIVLNRLEDCGDTRTWKGQGDNKRKDQDDTRARQDEDGTSARQDRDDTSELIAQDDTIDRIDPDVSSDRIDPDTTSDRIDPDDTGALLVLERDDSSVLLDADDISEQRGVCVVTLFFVECNFPIEVSAVPPSLPETSSHCSLLLMGCWIITM